MHLLKANMSVSMTPVPYNSLMASIEKNQRVMESDR